MRKTFLSPRKPSGFTLIELLVVIAIIAILAAILFPVFARARENARKSTCQSNLKQMALGVSMYIQDYDMTYPGFYQWTGAPVTIHGEVHPTGFYLSLADFIEPYTKNIKVQVCPSDTRAEDFNTRHNSYGFNQNFFGQSETSLTSNRGPADMLMLADALNSWFSIERIRKPASQGGTGWNDGYQERHMDGLNVAFMDGHVKWTRMNQLKYGNWSPFATSTTSPTADTPLPLP